VRFLWRGKKKLEIFGDALGFVSREERTSTKDWYSPFYLEASFRSREAPFSPVLSFQTPKDLWSYVVVVLGVFRQWYVLYWMWHRATLTPRKNHPKSSICSYGRASSNESGRR
jgi:hypothetical protein